jgi:hypothetical protein
VYSAGVVRCRTGGKTTHCRQVPTASAKIVLRRGPAQCFNIVLTTSLGYPHSPRSNTMANESNNQRGGSGNDPERTGEASRKGGQQSHGQQSHQGTGHSDPSQQGGSGSSGGQQRGGSGNFANDPERASEAGRKGGQQSHQDSGQSDRSQQGGSGKTGEQRGGSGNFANDPGRASEAGRKGGDRPQGRR